MLNNYDNLGSGCSTAVEHTPCFRQVVGSNPTGCWAFSLLISSASFIRSFIEVQHYFKNAMQLEAKIICTDGAKKVVYKKNFASCKECPTPFRSLWYSTTAILLDLQDLPGLSRGLLQPVHQRAHGGPQLNYWTRNGHQLGWPLSLVIPVSRLRKVSLSAWLVTGLGLFWDSLWLWASPVCTLAIDPHTPSSFTIGVFTSLWRI